MKVILLLAGLCVLASAVPTPAPTKWVPKKYKVEDKVFLEKQLNILRLFQFVQQPLHFKGFVDIAESYHPQDHLDLYSHPEYVKEFLYYYHHDILPKGHIFSVFDYQHLEQAIALFKSFYYAKDYDTFFKTAVWARQYVNEGLWLYAFSVAVVHRDDTFGIVLPPIYEIYPYYFYNAEVIYKAHYYKQIYGDEYPKEEVDYEGWTIPANYSGWYLNLHPEQKLSYFTEDIGLNAFYYYYHVYYPWWMAGDEFHLKNDRRSELFYAVHQQLWARYYSERLSYEYSPLPTFDPYKPIETGYYPSLEYPNGLDFPARPPYVPVQWDTSYGNHYYNFSYAFEHTHDYFRRLRDAVGIGFVFTHSGQKISLKDEKGIEIFANILEGNFDSANLDYYGIIQLYVRHILGYGPTPLDKDHLVPSVLQHYETALRDPVYWQFLQWIVYFFQEFKALQKVNHYTEQDLLFPGVKVESVQVDRLTTYFDWFYSDLSHAVYYSKKETEPFYVRARQKRLTYKPFTYTINVNSDKKQESVVRVFIGPKYDSYGRVIDMSENRLHFYLIDKFIDHLEPGKNVIVRNSKQTRTVSDKTSYWQLYKRVLGAIKGTEEFIIDGSETYWGLPNRLLLPIGKACGLPYQFYVIVTPYKPVAGSEVVPEDSYYPEVGSGGLYIDSLPLGFPFDKPSKYYGVLSNSYFQDVSIYHKKYEELNVSHAE